MLQVVGHAFAVNPDRQLSKIAHDEAWPILSFNHPVRAHDRSRSHTPFIVSALVISVAAVLGRLRLRRT
jgi:predicted permease